MWWGAWTGDSSQGRLCCRLQMTSLLLLKRHQHMLRSTRSGRRREERCESRSGLGLPQTRRLTSPWWPGGRLGFELRSYLLPTSTTSIAPAKPFFQPYRRILGARIKPLVGLEFTTIAKNFTYVPGCFDAEIRNIFPNASIVDDNTPRATMDQLKDGASRLPVGSSGLLISLVGVA